MIRPKELFLSAAICILASVPAVRFCARLRANSHTAQPPHQQRYTPAVPTPLPVPSPISKLAYSKLPETTQSAIRVIRSFKSPLESFFPHTSDITQNAMLIALNQAEVITVPGSATQEDKNAAMMATLWDSLTVLDDMVHKDSPAPMTIFVQTPQGAAPVPTATSHNPFPYDKRIVRYAYELNQYYLESYLNMIEIIMKESPHLSIPELTDKANERVQVGFMVDRIHFFHYSNSNGE